MLLNDSCPPPLVGVFRNLFGSNPGAGDGMEDFVVHAFMLDHPVPCTGFLFIEPPPLPRLIVEKAVKLGVKPGPLLGKLKQVVCSRPMLQFLTEFHISIRGSVLFYVPDIRSEAR